MTGLVIAGCSHAAAKHAVMHWHYSQAMPSSTLIKYGVWEDGSFRGAVLFGRGATPQLCKPYGLTSNQACELVRIALREHEAPVTQIVAVALRRLAGTNPGLRLVLSFADPAHGHHGGVYQGGNWIYLGRTTGDKVFRINGKLTHQRSVSEIIRRIGGLPQGMKRIELIRRVVDSRAEEVWAPPKHRYAYPLDKQMRRRIQRLAQPYPPPLDTLGAVGRSARA